MIRKIVVCVNHRANASQPSCGARGGKQLAQCLEEELSKRDLGVVVEHFNCLGQCESGPNMRLAPAGPFYHRVQLENLPALMAEIEQFYKTDPAKA